ncbi:MAG: DUF4350 domain-containing protein [Bacteroidota bacterium]
MTYRIFLAIVLVIVVIFLIWAGGKRPLNWHPTFFDGDKQPYGTYVLRDILPTMFSKGVSDISIPLSDTLSKVKGSGKNFIMIGNTNFYDMDTEELMYWVSNGNNAFISTNSLFLHKLTDTLGIDIEYYLKSMDFMRMQRGLYSTSMTLTNPNLDGHEYKYIIRDFERYINVDSLIPGTRVLGKYIKSTSTPDTLSSLNFIQIPYGDGNFYLHSFPYAFTNYHLTAEEYKYAVAALSYLPNEHVLWYRYHNKDYFVSQSPLRYILSQPELRDAFYIALASILLFMVFTFKRKQKAIPIVRPPHNHTLDFAATLGSLYFERSANEDIAEKKILHFKEYVSSKLRCKPDDKAAIAARSGVEPDIIDNIFKKIDEIKSAKYINDKKLIELSKEIDKFYMRMKHGRK